MQTVPKTAAEMVADAKQLIEKLSPDQVDAEIGRGVALIVDIREPEERMQRQHTRSGPRAAGHAGVLRRPFQPIPSGRVPPHRRTILYCASGAAGALAVVTPQQLGYSDIAHLDAGLKGWVASGREVVR
jgi:rhodanese-related sulfurtransferase